MGVEAQPTTGWVLGREDPAHKLEDNELGEVLRSEQTG